MPSPIINTILQNLPLRKPVDKVISSTRAGTELRGFIQKFNPFVEDVRAAIEDLDDRVTDATSTTINMDLAELNLPPGIQSEVHLHVTNLTIANPEGEGTGNNGGNSGNPSPLPPLTEVWPNSTNFYIDTVNGSDGNPGTSTAPVQSWGKLREIIATKRIPTTGIFVRLTGTLQAPLDLSGLVGVAAGSKLNLRNNGDPENAIVETPVNSFANLAEGINGLNLDCDGIKFNIKSRLIITGSIRFSACNFVTYSTSEQYFAVFKQQFCKRDTVQISGENIERRFL